MEPTDLIALTADIVAAHLSHNSVPGAELPALIASVHDALAKTTAPQSPAAVAQAPAVPIRSSVKPDYLVCLEDGRKLKMLKRHLRTTYDMSPEDYRAKWGLPSDYPMVAPAYAEKRRTLAHAIGLGRKGATETTSANTNEVVSETEAGAIPPTPRKRGRPAKSGEASASPRPSGIAAAKARAKAHLGVADEGPVEGRDGAPDMETTVPGDGD